MCESHAQRTAPSLTIRSTADAPSVAHAFTTAIADVLSDGHRTQPPSSPLSVGRSRHAYEILNYSLHIANPRDRLIPAKPRGIHIRYALGNFLWQLFERNDLAFIQYYNERGKNFSDDGKTLYGAYGPRLISQLWLISDQLKKDPMSRRAVAHIHQAQDLEAESRDIPCPLTMQFLIRGGRLHLFVTMRSQSTVMVLPYDLILMSMLQEMMAIGLDLPVGSYVHTAASMHIYEDEQQFGYNILKEMSMEPADRLTMPPMQWGDFSLPYLSAVESIETSVRAHGQKRARVKSPFWVWVGEQLEWWYAY